MCGSDFFSMCSIVKKYLCMRRKVFYAIVNFEKTCRVNRSNLRIMLQEYDMNEQLLKAMRMMYANSCASMRVNEYM